MDRHVLWIWFRLALSSNPKMMYALYSVIGDIDKIYDATREELTEWGVPTKYIAPLTDKNLAKAYNILGICQKFGYGVLAIDDDGYPESLRQIALPPCLLFYDGDFAACVVNHPAITFVGTRHSTASGESLAREFSAHLAQSGISVVCGVADGIDTAVRESVVDCDGRLVLVLPCGLNCISKKLAPAIRGVLARGAVVSELLPNERAPFDAYQLRNRLMSAFSDATLVCQAPLKSGALMTANYALEQGKEVYVLPGGLRDPSYAGGNSLLREGAQAVVDPSDIVLAYKAKWDSVEDIVEEDEMFEEYVSSVSEHALPSFQNSLQEKIFGAISADELTVEEIAEKCDISAIEIMTQLTMMELCGWVRSVPGGKFKLERF